MLLTAARRALACALIALGAGGTAYAQDPLPPSSPSPDADADQDEDEDEDEGLRQRLTEREDKRRPPEPFGIDLGGRRLTVGGEYEIGLGYVRRRVLDRGLPEQDRFLFEQSLELETFYSVGRPLSLFAQARVEMGNDLLPHTFDEVDDLFVERGEMWLASERVAGSPFTVDVGRLNFEDERRWWWDEELDAARVVYETESFEVALALARELAPSRSDRSYVDPDQERVLRLIGEASWDWRPDHALELFLLYQDDRSPTERPGQVVSFEREDEFDGELTWLGARLMGAFDLRASGILGYWLDTGLVRGHERRVVYDQEPDPPLPGRSEVTELLRLDVSGWAFDAGLSWMLPLAFEPRIYAGYAVGSGDSTPSDDDDATPENGDDSFRQTEVETNEAGFGGVERFPHYGVLLDPELSNLRIVTLGSGVSLLRSSSLDLVYHEYRMVESSGDLRDLRLELTLTGEHHDVGRELDLVLALEEWERLEFELIGSAFRAGRALGERRGTWSYGGFLVVRFAF